jgi:hypothetical protein
LFQTAQQEQLEPAQEAFLGLSFGVEQSPDTACSVEGGFGAAAEGGSEASLPAGEGLFDPVVCCP